MSVWFASIVQLLLLAPFSSIGMPLQESPESLLVRPGYNQALVTANDFRGLTPRNTCLSICRKLYLIASDPSILCTRGSVQPISDGRELWDFSYLFTRAILPFFKDLLFYETHPNKKFPTYRWCCCAEVRRFLLMQQQMPQFRSVAFDPKDDGSGCVLMKPPHTFGDGPHAMLISQDRDVFPILCHSTPPSLGPLNRDAGTPLKDDFLKQIHWWVDWTIAMHDVVVFAKSTCPYCIKAVELLEAYEVTDLRIEYLDETPHISHYVQDYLEFITGSRSVPRIFIFGRSVGGCDDLMELHECDELSNVLKKSV